MVKRKPDVYEFLRGLSPASKNSVRPRGTICGAGRAYDPTPNLNKKTDVMRVLTRTLRLAARLQLSLPALALIPAVEPRVALLAHLVEPAHVA